MKDVTRILNNESKNAAAQLLPVLYDELRQLATDRMAAENPGQTLSPTGLVHEAWIRLAGNKNDWESRGHFFGAAAEAMRRILIDNARRKLAAKHGGGHKLADFNFESLEDSPDDKRLIELSDALSKLADVDAAKAELVKLRYFAGCSIKESAELLGISTATADRYWAYSRAWLQTEMNAEA
ncbi:MAG: sigma-70 family RNA polymerase sigma factor [Planctomycetaceae bacterium]|jgi:RNA polymerase sigma factor (TIGR02999 family)|nr:sigma-70 family RNA polymerase sigma factor [Planctomycetaceae bacterium]